MLVTIALLFLLYLNVELSWVTIYQVGWSASVTIADYPATFCTYMLSWVGWSTSVTIATAEELLSAFTLNQHNPAPLVKCHPAVEIFLLNRIFLLNQIFLKTSIILLLQVKCHSVEMFLPNQIVLLNQIFLQTSIIQPRWSNAIQLLKYSCQTEYSC